MEFHEICQTIVDSYFQGKNLEIYYPRTENNPEGWREIELHSITTDIPPQGEKLVIGKDRLSPGHILNAYDTGAKDGDLRSFIIGKIKRTRSA